MSSSSHRSIPSEDRFSALPDSVLSHILSFLPTKSAAATTVLSKRWNPVWLSVLTLDFDAKSFKDYTTFRHAVYSVMLSRQITQPIQKLRLKCCAGYDIHDINRFVNAAIERGIETLNLDMYQSHKEFKLDMYQSIQFVEYVMQNSKKLRTMTIHSVCSIDVNAKNQMIQKLSVCPKRCKLIFN